MDMKNDKIIHLTEDNMKSLRLEVSSVREALQAKFPHEDFSHMLPHLDPDRIIPEDCLFEEVLGPDPEEHIYGKYGWTIHPDRVPYSIYLAKFVGIQMDVETPFIEELLLWVTKINNNDGEEVPCCRNSQWRYNLFKKRRELLQAKLVLILQKEITDLVMMSQQYKDGSLIEKTGYFSFYGFFFQKKLLQDDDNSS